MDLPQLISVPIDANVMGASELLDDLSVRIYAPPLSLIRDDGRICDTSNPLAVIILLIDYETECLMSGIVGFLGNSAGAHLSETVTALRGIGCDEHAAKLTTIEQIADRAGMTHSAIQSDRSGLTEFTITSFAKLHGDKWDDACREIREVHATVDFDEFWIQLTSFVRDNENEIRRRATQQ